ncbi:MAG: DNA polymerase IV [candidate division WOR-3 bacterium]|nr:DNA polymerase IV [candidate division WOR-3 bacterium]MCX7757898.1 DNA polymerase IV [candidate division WOR-3 bacterium]MDW7987353.1 DNA polymerase IV [candidate division WOR-3 bacterium]
MLIDMDAFFAQIEQRDQPELKGKPVLVIGGPGKRTVVTASSYEAKKFGVKSGMPLYQALKLCPDAKVVFGDHEKYLNCSYELLKIYKQYTDLVEPYSIDEAFLDVTQVQSLFGTPQEIAQKIKAQVRNKLNLSCSIGIGPNKLLAKMVADFNKPDGLTIINYEDIPEMIWPLSVEKLFGVGVKISQRLNKLGINTIGDLARYPKAKLIDEFGVYGAELHNRAWGMDFSAVDPKVAEEISSIGHSYTLPYDTDELSLIKWYLDWLSSKVAERLLKDKLKARTIQLVVRFSDFKTKLVQVTLKQPIETPAEISKVAYELFLKNFKGRKIRLIGIRTGNLTNFSKQLELFNTRSKIATVFMLANKLNEKYQKTIIEPGALLVKNKARYLRKKVGCFLSHHQKRLFND